MGKIVQKLEMLKDLPLLFIRLVLAYGFYEPAMMKLKDVGSIAEWFASMDMPLPTFNAYLVTGAEISGVVLLTLGLFTRYISVALIISMMVAIKMMHWDNGFNAGNNGFEIPLYYAIMLFTLVIYGSGRLSVDKLMGKKYL